MSGTIMPLCPKCREAMADRYAAWPVENDAEDWRMCGMCILPSAYYGQRYELQPRYKKKKAAAPARHAGEDDKKENWREFRQKYR
nr:MAG TPA: hypothetical protein [Caudoviricetes sp.]